MALVFGLPNLACTSTKPASASYFSSLDYQARETLRQSLFREDLSLLSNEEIERILSSKIELPGNARLALLQLGGDPHVLVLPAPDADESHSLAALFERLGASKRLSSVTGASSSEVRQGRGHGDFALEPSFGLGVGCQVLTGGSKLLSFVEGCCVEGPGPVLSARSRLTSRFVKVFSPVALAFSTMAALILTAQVVISFSLSASEMQVTSHDGMGPLSALLLRHFRMFSVACWSCSVLGVVAAIGLLRRRRWAHTTWVVLLALALLWSLAFLTSEAVYLLSEPRALDEVRVLLPSTKILSALVVFPVGVFMIALTVVLLRRLVANRGSFQ